MNDMIAIKAENISKRYKVYASPKDMFLDFLGVRKRYTDKWALQNINFEVQRGDVVGLLGRNGAGKSTLLKIISGIVPATEGKLTVKGKISSILELGTGFHPEYTGRENILMGGMCLGMSKEEIYSKMDSIIDFSELREYIDRPFKTYSSGMQSRLTFATAISIDPDILIIDEALAAGDGFFVNKCLKRIKEICNSGTTVFFVSHSTDLVRRLCNRAMFINNGKLEKVGDAAEICTYYDSMILEAASDAGKSVRSEDGSQFQTDSMRITDVKVLNEDGEECYAFFQNSKLQVRVTLESSVEYENPGLWIKFMRSDGILATSWFSLEPIIVSTGKIKIGKNVVSFKADDLLLGDGVYFLGVGIFPNKQGADSIFYNDPFCLWEGGCKISIKRRGRPLSTVFDQPMIAFVSEE